MSLSTAQERTLAFPDLVDVGYDGNGYLVEDFFEGALTSRTLWFDYGVGDRVLLSVVYAHRSPVGEVDRGLLDELIRAQIEHLKGAGLG